eukprot:40538-Prymnesium_polylepis.1
MRRVQPGPLRAGPHASAPQPDNTAATAALAEPARAGHRRGIRGNGQRVSGVGRGRSGRLQP